SKRIFSRYFLLQFLQQNLTSSPLTLSAMSSFTGSPEIGHLTTSCLASSFAAAWSPSGAEPRTRTRSGSAKALARTFMSTPFDPQDEETFRARHPPRGAGSSRSPPGRLLDPNCACEPGASGSTSRLDASLRALGAGEGSRYLPRNGLRYREVPVSSQRSRPPMMELANTARSSGTGGLAVRGARGSTVFAPPARSYNASQDGRSARRSGFDSKLGRELLGIRAPSGLGFRMARGSDRDVAPLSSEHPGR